MKNQQLLAALTGVAMGALAGTPDDHPMRIRFNDTMRLMGGQLPPQGHRGAAQVLSSPATDLRIPKRKKNVNRPRRAGRKEG